MTLLQRGRLSRAVYHTLEHLWEVEKYTTSHLESLDKYFLLKVYMLHAGSEIFHDAKVGGGVTGRCHDDVTCGKKNCEQPLTTEWST